MSTEKLEQITKELETSGTLTTVEDFLNNVPGEEQYLDFLQQIDECISLEIPLTVELILRISSVISESVYFECDYAALCAD